MTGKTIRCVREVVVVLLLISINPHVRDMFARRFHPVGSIAPSPCTSRRASGAGRPARRACIASSSCSVCSSRRCRCLRTRHFLRFVGDHRCRSGQRRFSEPHAILRPVRRGAVRRIGGGDPVGIDDRPIVPDVFPIRRLLPEHTLDDIGGGPAPRSTPLQGGTPLSGAWPISL